MLQILGPSNYRQMPWKNGAGTTEEIFIYPPTTAPQSDFVFRLSVATITKSDKFSDFTGYDRCLIPLSDRPLVLTHDQEQKSLGPYEPYFFTGEMPTSCIVEGPPTKDFNVMTKRGKAAMHVDSKTLYPQQYLQRNVKADWTFFYCIIGTVTLMMTATQRTLALPQHHTLVGQRNFLSGDIMLRAGADTTRILVVEITIL